MRKLHYYLVDVFTDRAFGGNPLAVFTDAEGISAELMQTLARELNLSESTFVLPARQAGNNYQVRIFTPAAELPMAGHPTLGTAFVLADQRFISLNGSETRLIFEEGVGPIAVSLFAQAGQVQTIQMQQPLPTFGPVFADREIIASMLSLKLADLENELPLEAVSCGVPFLFVPIKKLAAMRRIRFRQDLWERELSGFAAPHVLAFTREVETAGSSVHSRVFVPGMGISEDPATGAASGPLGCYLVRHELVKLAASTEIISEQGIEMGRPSFIHIKIQQADNNITGVFVGGQARFIGEGYIQVDA